MTTWSGPVSFQFGKPKRSERVASRCVVPWQTGLGMHNFRAAERMGASQSPFVRYDLSWCGSLGLVEHIPVKSSSRRLPKRNVGHKNVYVRKNLKAVKQSGEIQERTRIERCKKVLLGREKRIFGGKVWKSSTGNSGKLTRGPMGSAKRSLWLDSGEARALKRMKVFTDASGKGEWTVKGSLIRHVDRLLVQKDDVRNSATPPRKLLALPYWRLEVYRAVKFWNLSSVSLIEGWWSSHKVWNAKPVGVVESEWPSEVPKKEMDFLWDSMKYSRVFGGKYKNPPGFYKSCLKNLSSRGFGWIYGRLWSDLEGSSTLHADGWYIVKSQVVSEVPNGVVYEHISGSWAYVFKKEEGT